MNTTSALHNPPATQQQPIFPPTAATNPWTSDNVLLSLSIWWVQMTRPESRDFSGDVAVFFDSLQRDLQ